MATSSSSTSGSDTGARPPPDRGRLVWDLPLRICHWGLVLGCACSWATGELGAAWFRWHVGSGCVLLVLVAFRLAWGFVGPTHARFGSFLAGPRRVVTYARHLLERNAATTVGHNPLGGWAVLAMLTLLGAQAVSGLFANDDIFNTGPLYGYVSDQMSDSLAGFHKRNFVWLALLAGVHVAAVLYYRAWKHIDLVRPMLTGRKASQQVPVGQEIDGQRIWLAVALVAIAAGVLYYVVRTAPVAEMSLF